METRFHIRSFDSPLTFKAYVRLPKAPVTVILDNLRSAYNVGSIFRTADAARIEKIIPCGYTAHPPHRKLDKTALGTEKYVKSEYCKDTVEAVRKVKALGMHVVALETADNVAYYSDYPYPKPLALVVGNEALGVSDAVLNEVDSVVQIPLYGFKNSLNVVCAFAIVLYEIRKQWGFEPPLCNKTASNHLKEK
jgi:tRNA G18 (ribose-2'-O)-methylase SpoU